MKRILVLPLAFILALSILAGCAASDVVLKYGRSSLAAITEAEPALVAVDAAAGDFVLTADGSTRIRVSQDFSLSGKADIRLETPIRPFLDAGLDPSKLGEGYAAVEDTLTLTGDYGPGTGAASSFRDALFQAVSADRKNLAYHQALDHYGVKLMKGKFEWARDFAKNDKDLVFVIAAGPLADLGVDVEHVAGWAFMTVQEPDGTDVDILAKPYDLE